MYGLDHLLIVIEEHGKPTSKTLRYMISKADFKQQKKYCVNVSKQSCNLSKVISI